MRKGNRGDALVQHLQQVGSSADQASFHWPLAMFGAYLTFPMKKKEKHLQILGNKNKNTLLYPTLGIKTKSLSGFTGNAGDGDRGQSDKRRTGEFLREDRFPARQPCPV